MRVPKVDIDEHSPSAASIAAISQEGAESRRLRSSSRWPMIGKLLAPVAVATNVFNSAKKRTPRITPRGSKSSCNYRGGLYRAKYLVDRIPIGRVVSPSKPIGVNKVEIIHAAEELNTKSILGDNELITCEQSRQHIPIFFDDGQEG